MIATSLSDGGNELLGQRRGLDAYVSAGKTMGIPLLYPWANRLSAKTYDVDGETVTLAPDAYGVRPDNNGCPSTVCWRPIPDGEHGRSPTRSSPPNWISERRTNCVRASRSRIWSS